MNVITKFFRTLRSRLFVIILVIYVAVFLGIAALYDSYSCHREEKMAMERTSALIEQLAMSFDFRFINIEKLLHKYAPVVTASLDSPENLPSLLDDVLESDTLILGSSVAYVPDAHPGNEKLYMVYRWHDNDTVKTKILGSQSYYYPEKDWFYDAISEGSEVWSEPYYDDGCGDVAMITYSLPLRDEHGGIVAVFTADFLLSRILGSLGELEFYNPSYSFLLSESGIYIAPWNEGPGASGNILNGPEAKKYPTVSALAKEIISSDSGKTKITVNGETVLVCYTSVPDLPWKICNLCPETSILGHLTEVKIWSIVVFIIGLLLLLYGTNRVLRKEAEPLRDFATHGPSAGHSCNGSSQRASRDNADLRMLNNSILSTQRSMVMYIDELRKAGTEQAPPDGWDLEIARRLQSRMLPSGVDPFPHRQDIDIFAALTASPQVGGDMYDYFLRDNKLFFTVGDVAGTGISAAMFLAVAGSMFRLLAQTSDSPAEIAASLNHAFSENNENGMTIAMFLGVLDLATGILDYCNAGYSSPLYFSREKGAAMLPTVVNSPMGISDKVKFTWESVSLADAGLVIYSDGVKCAENKSGTPFTEKRLMQTVAVSAHRDAVTVGNRLIDELSAFIGSTPVKDDLTLLCIRLASKSPDSRWSLRIKADMGEMSRVEGFLGNLVTTGALRENELQPMLELLKKKIKAIIANAYSGVVGGIIAIDVVKASSPCSLTVILSDFGIPFDSSIHFSPEDGDVMQLDSTPGQFCIPTPGEVVDYLAYRRIDNTNILVMKKFFC